MADDAEKVIPKGTGLVEEKERQNEEMKRLNRTVNKSAQKGGRHLLSEQEDREEEEKEQKRQEIRERAKQRIEQAERQNPNLIAKNPHIL